MAKDQLSSTVAAIKSLDGSAFVTLHSRLDRGGALQARKLANGAVQLYWRYSHAGKTSREPIGVYDPAAPPRKLQPTQRGYGIAAALEKCRTLADVHVERADTGGLQEVKAEKRKTFLAQKVVEAEKSTRTLQKLLDAYVAHLKTQGRRSHVDANQIFKSHITAGWPAVVEAPAVDLTPDQVLDMLRRLIESGKGRTATSCARTFVRRTSARSMFGPPPRFRWSSKPSASSSILQPRPCARRMTEAFYRALAGGDAAPTAIPGNGLVTGRTGVFTLARFNIPEESAGKRCASTEAWRPPVEQPIK